MFHLRSVAIGIAVLIGLFVLMQLVPYGRAHTNPPSGAEPKWDSPQTRELTVRACFDCHSNQTEWPWYSNVAPLSWLIQRDVDEGRSKMNLTDWGRPQREVEEAARDVRDGKMPQWYYLILHPSANLTSDEKAALMQGLQKTLGAR